MIRSMTGYGSAEVAGERIAVAVEVRSLNHRYLDISLRLPRSLASLELEARRLIHRHLHRGRVDVSAALRPLTSGALQVRVDGALAREYAERARQLAVELGRSDSASLEWLLERPGVLSSGEPGPLPVEECWPLLAEALTAALGEVSARREAEGEALREALVGLYDGLVSEGERMAAQVPVAVARRKEQFGERVQELLGAVTLDQGRLAMEVALWAQKTEIAEELTRLRAHLDQFAGLLKEGGAVGRTMDFLIQEMNREVNTVASKAEGLELSQSAVTCKGLLEKLREQIQNIE
ncbi:MAG: YicC/YloC family endoribonuclease [Candidatus Methylomirabilia bacterium]